MPKSSIASLFGPSAEEIVYARQQQDKLQEEQRYQSALARQQSLAAQSYYESGYNIAKGLGGLLGGDAMMVDPAIQKAIKVRKVVSEFDGKNLNDPTVLESIAERMADLGYVNEATMLFDRAFDLEYKTATLEAAREQKKITTGVVGLDENNKEVVLLQDNYGNLYDANTRKLWTGNTKIKTSGTDIASLMSQFQTGKGGGSTGQGTDLDGKTVGGTVDDPAARAELERKIKEKEEERKRQASEINLIPGV